MFVMYLLHTEKKRTSLAISRKGTKTAVVLLHAKRRKAELDIMSLLHSVVPSCTLWLKFPMILK
jgi:hypothetical protein